MQLMHRLYGVSAFSFMEYLQQWLRRLCANVFMHVSLWSSTRLIVDAVCTHASKKRLGCMHVTLLTGGKLQHRMLQRHLNAISHSTQPLHRFLSQPTQLALPPSSAQTTSYYDVTP